MSANTSYRLTEAAGSPKPAKRRFDQTGTPSHSSRSAPSESPRSDGGSGHKRQHRELVDDRLNAIEEHGVIGNMRTCALISVSAEVCWFCYPNFDSPSIFASILDTDKGGSWTISAYIDDDKDSAGRDGDSNGGGKEASGSTSHEHGSVSALPAAPASDTGRATSARNNNPKKVLSKTSEEAQQQRELVRRYVTHKQLYHSDTNVLISRFLSDDGVGQVLDYMPAGRVAESAKRWLVRELGVVRGQMTFQVELTPAFNYARDSHTVSIEKYGARFVSEKLTMELRTTRPLDWQLTDDGKGVSCLVELNENEKEVFIFSESEQCAGGDWKTGGSEEALFVSSEPRKRDEVRHEWNEGVTDVVHPIVEADGSPRAGNDKSRRNGGSNEGVRAAPQPSPGESKVGDESKEGESGGKGGGGGGGVTEAAQGMLRKAMGEKVWRSTASLARMVGWEEKQDTQPNRKSRQSGRANKPIPQASLDSRSMAARTNAEKQREEDVAAAGKKGETSAEAQADDCMMHEHPHDDSLAADDSADAADGDSAQDDERVILSDDELYSSEDELPTDGGSPHSIRRVSVDVAGKLRDHTINFWRDWIAKCTYNGRWREVVYRSVLVLKLMTFEPTGAIVAALTTSLPEQVGGERNWDYRFTWIRDSSFVLYAFLKLGFKEEAASFMQWISQRCEESSEQDGSLQIMYGLHGEHKLEEKTLDHLAGYKHSRPVHIGNGAYNQMQLDIYGELLDTVYLSNKYAEPISYRFWQHVRRMVDWVCRNWRMQDEGIWETRGGKKDFVYSKVMCWVAVDRGIRLAEKRSFPCRLDQWRAVRDDIYEEVQTKGWNEQRKAYTQSYGSDVLDASVLIMPLVFFVAPTDPRFVSTLEQVLASTTDGGLVSNNLVFRYNAEQSGDGLQGQEGTFSICTFWAVEAAARLGAYRRDYLDRSRTMFEQMLGYANHLGLFAEEIGKRGEHLGNFPQAFTHLALISAAINLDKALAHKVPGTSNLGSA